MPISTIYFEQPDRTERRAKCRAELVEMQQRLRLEYTVVSGAMSAAHAVHLCDLARALDIDFILEVTPFGSFLFISKKHVSLYVGE